MNVGDYIRTKDGIILKIKDVEDIYTTDNIYVGMSIYDNEGHFVNNVEIIKSSPSIIDLIEVGDYVNGCLIVEITKDPFIKGQINLWTNMILSEGEPFPNEYFKEKIIEKDIKSIVTKEQFESMEYEVE